MSMDKVLHGCACLRTSVFKRERERDITLTTNRYFLYYLSWTKSTARILAFKISSVEWLQLSEKLTDVSKRIFRSFRPISRCSLGPICHDFWSERWQCHRNDNSVRQKPSNQRLFCSLCVSNKRTFLRFGVFKQKNPWPWCSLEGRSR